MATLEKIRIHRNSTNHMCRQEIDAQTDNVSILELRFACDVIIVMLNISMNM